MRKILYRGREYLAQEVQAGGQPYYQLPDGDVIPAAQAIPVDPGIGDLPALPEPGQEITKEDVTPKTSKRKTS